MDELVKVRFNLQETMNFLGALAGGIEEAVGRPANDITYVAGKQLGRRFSSNAPPTDDIAEALQTARRVLEENNCLWDFEVFQASDRPEAIQSTAEGDEVMLVFRDCMIRQTLFCYGHHQKGSLCTMMYGFFAGALETIMGRESTLEIVHAGENACLKRLVVRAKPAC